MRKRPTVGAETLCLAIFLAASNHLAFGQSDAMLEPSLALVHATIYPNPIDNPIRDGVVLVQDGKIAAVGPRSSVRVPAGHKDTGLFGANDYCGFLE